jgi:hypothetical protein
LGPRSWRGIETEETIQIKIEIEGEIKIEKWIEIEDGE